MVQAKFYGAACLFLFLLCTGLSTVGLVTKHWFQASSTIKDAEIKHFKIYYGLWESCIAVDVDTVKIREVCFSFSHSANKTAFPPWLIAVGAFSVLSVLCEACMLAISALCTVSLCQNQAPPRSSLLQNIFVIILVGGVLSPLIALITFSLNHTNIEELLKMTFSIIGGDFTESFGYSYSITWVGAVLSWITAGVFLKKVLINDAALCIEQFSYQLEDQRRTERTDSNVL